mgnify:CR=1 FL=1
MLIYTIIAALIIAADQVSKIFLAQALENGRHINVIPKILSLVYVENRGAAFGILQGARIFFIVLTVIVLAAAIVYIVKMRPQSVCEKLALAFIAGGAVGNFIDRMSNGYVVDFFYFEWIDFPIFNVADIYVVVSCILFLLLIFFYYKEEDFAFLTEQEQKNDNT